MLVRAPNGTYEDIDFREKAPAAATEDMYNNNVVRTFQNGTQCYLMRSSEWQHLRRPR